MVFSNLNRLFFGLLLLIAVFFSYITNADNFFLLVILILITHDFYKIKTNKYFLIAFFILFLLNFFIIPYDYFKFLFVIEISLIILTFLSKKYKREIFICSIFLFCLIFYFIINVNREIFYLIIFISFFNDTIAYVAGKNIGGALIIPKISPSKTWSGTMISFVITTLLLFFLKFNILLSIITSISLFFGDIFFSYIKRYLNLKDFSNLFGDHGGVLDRLDSMFFVAIIFQIYLVVYV